MNEHAMPRAASADTTANIEQRFWSMHKASRSEPPTTAAERKALLGGLRDMVSEYTREFSQAISQDYGWRSHDETLMAEVVPALTIVRDA